MLLCGVKMYRDIYKDNTMQMPLLPVGHNTVGQHRKHSQEKFSINI